MAIHSVVTSSKFDLEKLTISTSDKGMSYTLNAWYISIIASYTVLSYRTQCYLHIIRNCE